VKAVQNARKDIFTFPVFTVLMVMLWALVLWAVKMIEIAEIIW